MLQNKTNKYINNVIYRVAALFSASSLEYLLDAFEKEVIAERS